MFRPVRVDEATTGDIILSVFLPGFGIAIGLLALARKQKKRGLTMISIGGGLIALITIVSFA